MFLLGEMLKGEHRLPQQPLLMSFQYERAFTLLVLPVDLLPAAHVCVYMGMLKIHSHICGNRWFVQIQHHTLHICPICAAVRNVSERRGMRIGAILEDAREQTEKWIYLFG